MKVLIATHGIFPELVGGMERHSHLLAQHLQKKGIEAWVAAPRHHQKAFSFPYPIQRFDWPAGHWLKSNHTYSKKVGEFLCAEKFDVVLSQGYNVWAALKDLPMPCVFHPHGLEMYGQNQRLVEKIKLTPLRWITRYHAKHSTATISLGGKLTPILRDQVGVPAEKLFEIPNAIEFKASTQSKNKEPRSILFVGRFAFNKGIDLLLGAWEQLREKDVSLCFAGDGPLRDLIAKAADKDSRISMVINPDDDHLNKLYTEKEAFIFTSRFEGMPTVILEAMRAHCFVIATDIGAVSTMVKSDFGVLMSPHANSIRDAIACYLAMPPAELENKQALGHQYARDHFDWSEVTSQYLKLFKRLLG